MDCKLPKQIDFSKIYYKILNEEMIHNNFPYCDKDGKLLLNQVIEDVIPFSHDGTCVAGGLYFTDEFNIVSFFNYGYWIAEIKIPEDAKCVLDPEGDKYRADKLQIINIYEISKYLITSLNIEKNNDIMMKDFKTLFVYNTYNTNNK